MMTSTEVGLFSVASQKGFNSTCIVLPSNASSAHFSGVIAFNKCHHRKQRSFLTENGTEKAKWRQLSV